MTRPSRRPVLVVLGMMGRCPFAGQTWLYANWLTALASTGADVVYVEDDIVWPYDPVTDTVTDDASYAVAHVERTLAQIGFTGRWAVRFDPIRKSDRTRTCFGMSERELDVLRLLGTDLGGPDIARELVVSLHTVRSHTKSIYAKLGVNSRRAAVSRAEELHLLSRGSDR